MKRTQYFESVADVSKYYPDGVPSTVIAIVGDGSNVFVSSDNAASGNQQYYSADMTNDEIVAEQVSAAEAQGYDTGYAAGQAAGGGADWLGILWLDEEAKAKKALGVSEWSAGASKYNFANDYFGASCVDPSLAAGLAYGVAGGAVIAKIIKISEDNNGNSVITNHSVRINFNGGIQLGAFSLDGVDYYTKLCIFSDPITLEVGDEVIMSFAGSIDGYSTMIFGGYDPDAYEMEEFEGETYKNWLPSTYKCTTAGTYTFGMLIDQPGVPDPEATAFVSTRFTYESQETVPPMTGLTGEVTTSNWMDTLYENELSLARQILNVPDMQGARINAAWNFSEYLWMPGKDVIDTDSAYQFWVAANLSESMGSIETSEITAIGKLIKIHTDRITNVPQISYAPIYASQDSMIETFSIHGTEYGTNGEYAESNEHLIYGTVYLEPGDEVILSIAFKSPDGAELCLFGYDESLQPYEDQVGGWTIHPYAPFKAQATGTYAFGMYVKPRAYSQLFVVDAFDFTPPETVIQLCSNDISKRDLLDHKARKVLTSSTNGIEIDGTHYFVSNDVRFEEYSSRNIMNTTDKSFSVMDSHLAQYYGVQSQDNFEASILYVSVIDKDNVVTYYASNTGTYDGSSDEYGRTLGYTWTIDNIYAAAGDLIKVVYNSGMAYSSLQQASNTFYTKTFIAPANWTYTITVEQKYNGEGGIFDNQITLTMDD